MPRNARESKQANCLALAAVAEKVGNGWRVNHERAVGKSAGRSSVLTAAQRREVVRIVEALASPHRITILTTLLNGPATYKGLAKATGLKVGPLYHHVAQLRMAAMIAPKERDLYRLTRGGRNCLLILAAAVPLARDRRPLEV